MCTGTICGQVCVHHSIVCKRVCAVQYCMCSGVWAGREEYGSHKVNIEWNVKKLSLSINKLAEVTSDFFTSTSVAFNFFELGNY